MVTKVLDFSVEVIYNKDKDNAENQVQPMILLVIIPANRAQSQSNLRYDGFPIEETAVKEDSLCLII